MLMLSLSRPCFGHIQLSTPRWAHRLLFCLERAQHNTLPKPLLCWGLQWAFGPRDRMTSRTTLLYCGVCTTAQAGHPTPWAMKHKCHHHRDSLVADKDWALTGFSESLRVKGCWLRKSRHLNHFSNLKHFHFLIILNFFQIFPNQYSSK